MTERDDIAWLVSAAGEAALREAAQMSGELTARIARLRKTLSPEQARLVIEQVGLRKRGVEKFSRAERMFFTAVGLEQATDEGVARYKAARFEKSAAVFDLCSGIGGDLLGLAAVCDRATGVDLDPVSACFAEANTRVAGLDNVSLRCAEVTSIGLAECDAWHLDPDRRPEGRRTTRVELHSPDSTAIDRMLAANPHAAIKLAPAAEWPEAWTERAEWEWISRGRQCRQLVAWFGRLATQPSRRRATLLDASGQSHTLVGAAGDELPLATALGAYVHEPDPAVLAADLTQALAGKHGLSALTPGVAYWTGPEAICDPLLSSFEVLETLPLDFKRLRADLLARDAGSLEIKVRGLQEDPGKLRQRLALKGSTPLTLLLCRIQRRATAIVARRIAPAHVAGQ